MSAFNSAHAQRTRLLQALRCAPVSTIVARRELDILSPAPRIMELRQRGFDIETFWQHEATDCGRTHRIGLYVLTGEANADVEGARGDVWLQKEKN